MNEKTKKVVAGIVLGTFTFGCVTPAFASDNIEKTLLIESVAIEKSERDNISSSDVEIYSVPSKIAKELAEKLLKNWDKVLNVFVDLGADEALLKKINSVKNVLLGALNEYNGVLTTAEEILAEALMNVGLGESLANVAAKAIIKILL